ncbi:MAG: glycosyltransferase family 4 protein [Deltaproteobacteria bacterium]|nr:glycosyltransferase family 4 protein [Deltaproteobacteria bacterium]
MDNVRKKKVLIVVTPLSVGGGLFRRLKLWTKYLSRDYEIEVMCYAPHENSTKVLEKKGVKIHREQNLNHIGRYTVLPGTLAIYRKIASYSPDIVISMFLWADFLTACAVSLRKMLRKKPIPHIVHIAGSPRPVANRVLRMIDRTIAIRGFSTPEKIITLCQHDAHMVSLNYFVKKDRIAIVPIGIEFFPFTQKEKLHSPFTFGVVSRLVPVKNIETIIRVFHEILKDEDNAVRLEIFGDGNYRETLEAIVNDRGLSAYITFRGWVQDPRSAFDAIDCLLSFSHSEGTPRSILEAGERGVPTIAREVGGVGELIKDGETGYIVSSEQELKEKMLSMLHAKEEDVLNMGVAARQFMQEYHSIESEIHGLKNLIEELTVGY